MPNGHVSNAQMARETLTRDLQRREMGMQKWKSEKEEPSVEERVEWSEALV